MHFTHTLGSFAPADTADLKKNFLGKKIFLIKRSNDSTSSTGYTNVSYTLNGKEISREEMQKLGPGQIKSINIIKGEKNLPEEYKTRQGVIAITLKDSKITEQ
jgi:hypothetical protein